MSRQQFFIVGVPPVHNSGMIEQYWVHRKLFSQKQKLRVIAPNDTCFRPTLNDVSPPRHGRTTSKPSHIVLHPIEMTNGLPLHHERGGYRFGITNQKKILARQSEWKI